MHQSQSFVSRQHSLTDWDLDEAESSCGLLIAHALSGSWRRIPPRLGIPDEQFEKIVPLLLASGSGPLAWWKIHSSGLSSQRLRDAYVHYAIQTMKQERNIVELFHLLGSRGIAAILIKGWSVARLYPEIGMRPMGDIDLLVPAQQLDRTKILLSQPSYRYLSVDLYHDEFTRFKEHTFEELFASSHQVCVDGVPVRVLGTEDHLRLLCLHFLKHGGWRPLWLCDIAVLLEHLPKHFKWSRCLGTDRRQIQWILCAISLAQSLLGAEPTIQVPKTHLKVLPQWLKPSVLAQWNSPLPPNRGLFLEKVKKHYRQPELLIHELRLRWPNPIQASVDTNSSFNWFPRAPIQLSQYVSRALRILRSVT